MLKSARIFLLTLAAICGLLLAPVSYAATATLTWDANTESDLAGYKIYRLFGTCPTVGPTFFLAQVAATVRTYVDTTVPDTIPGVIYEITAIDAGGAESGKSNRVCKVLINVTPAAPTNLRVTGWPRQDQIELAWNGQAESYRLEYASGNSWARLLDTLALSAVVGLPPSGRHVFRVCATVQAQRVCGRDGAWASR